MGDILFPVRNLFYLGAYQSAINEAQDLTSLSDLDSITRDVFVYRSYIALGSSQVRLQAPSSQQMTILVLALTVWCCVARDQRNPRRCSPSATSREALCRVQGSAEAQGAPSATLILSSLVFVASELSLRRMNSASIAWQVLPRFRVFFQRPSLATRNDTPQRPT